MAEEFRIATKEYCNSLVPGAFSGTASELKECPTYSEINATGKFTILGSHEDNQLVRQTEIDIYQAPYLSLSLTLNSITYPSQGDEAFYYYYVYLFGQSNFKTYNLLGSSSSPIQFDGSSQITNSNRIDNDIPTDSYKLYIQLGYNGPFNRNFSISSIDAPNFITVGGSTYGINSASGKSIESNTIPSSKFNQSTLSISIFINKLVLSL